MTQNVCVSHAPNEGVNPSKVPILETQCVLNKNNPDVMIVG